MRPGGAIVIAAICAAAPAQAQFLPDGMSPSPRSSHPAFLFTAPAAGAYSSLTPTIGPTISCSRNSTATYEPDGGSGSRTTAAINTCRVEGAGLLVEGASTNNLLNSDSPATQTTASLSTGSYAGWVEGSGSLAFTAGTVTATGLPCTATAGGANDCHITITGAGTIVATVSGTVTFFQLEPQPARTSAIHTAGTVASRVADVVSFAKPSALTISGGSYSVSADVALEGIFSSGQVALGSNQNFAPYLRIAVGPNSVVSGASDSSATLSTIARSDANKMLSTRYALIKRGTALTVYADGVPGSTVTTSTQTAEPTTIYVGSASVNTLNGYIGRACIGKGAACRP